jgi:peptide deformylase
MTQPDPYAVIRQWGDPALREKAREVEDFDAALGEQVAELLQVMFDADGAGLAATQVGVLRRIFVYRLAEEPPQIVVNPVIVESAEERDTGLEGCLSLGQATVLVEVERPVTVVVEAQNLKGEPTRIEAKGLHARILQHEIDHLDGVLMLDRTTAEQRRAAVRALSRGEAWRPPREPEADEA